MARRSNLIVALGLAVFVVGAGATYLLARNDDGGTPTAGKGGVVVLYAHKPVPSGTGGSAAVNNGLVKQKVIAESAKPANALTDPSQIAGKTATLGVAEGQILTADQFKDAQTRIGTLNIPDGKTALALSMGNVPGVAGFAGAGDLVNVYGILKPESGSQVKLIMQNVQVLNVNGTTLAGAQGQPGGPGLVFLLAVSPAEAEQLVHLTTFQQLYFALAAKDRAPVDGTPGVTPRDALKTL